MIMMYFFSISADAGLTWSQPQKPYQDSTPAAHGFVSVFPALGQVGMVWLDGREVAKKSLIDFHYASL